MADEDKDSGANNSGSDGGVSPLPLTLSENFALKNTARLNAFTDPRSTLFDGRRDASSDPRSALFDGRRDAFSDPRSSLYQNFDQFEAEAPRPSTANSNITAAVTPGTDSARPSATANPLQGFQNSGGPRGNPLDAYTNYTYGITLYAAPTNEYTPGTVNGEVLMASGGRREGRSSLFKEDFYFENFKIESIIGLNAKSRSSNVITVDFTVVEPYGMTLMDRILALANQFGVKNWYEMLFTLQVDFYGNNDDGSQSNPIPAGTKYFQVGLIGCDIKVGTRGAEYKFSAIPFSHHAYQQTVGTVPAKFEAIGEKVSDIFADDGKGSFAKALNEYYENLVETGHASQKDVYKFNIDGSIAEATIVSNKENEVKSSPMPSTESPVSKDQALSATKSGQPIQLVLSKQRVPVNAGTSIIDFINLIIRSSTYIENQMKPGGGDSGGKINWFKIIPEIEYGSFDEKRNTHQKTITYHVIPYVLYNTKYPDASMGQPTSWSKEYNWIYTGLNQQILDFNVDFNTMFYTMMTSDRNKIVKGEVKPEGGEDTDKEKEEKGSGAPLGAGTIAPTRKVFIAGNAPMSGVQQGKNDVAKTASNDFYNSLMSSSRGDMININLKIAGDPEFVKQDDIYYGPRAGSGDSLNMDTEEVYIKIFFKTPTDIIQETGQMDFETYPNSVFSGIYRVLRVESVFDRGQFIQNLDCIRLFGEGDNPGGGSSASERSESSALGDARSRAQTSALEQTQEMMNNSRLNSYTDPRSTLFSGRNNAWNDERSLLRERPTAPVEGIDQAEAERETRRLFNRFPPAQQPAATIDPFNVNDYFTNSLPPAA